MPAAEPETEPEFEPTPEPELFTPPVTEYLPEVVPESGDVVRGNILTVVYVVYILVIVCGNAFVLTVLIRHGRCRENVMYVFLLSLTVADLVVGCLVVPSGLFNVHYKGDMSGMVCKACHYFLHTARSATVFSLVGVTVDRYLRIMTSLRVNFRQACITVAVLWAFGAFYAIRAPVFYDEVIRELSTGGSDRGGLRRTLVCSIADEFAAPNNSFVYIDTLLLFVLPWGLVAICYAVIVRMLMKDIRRKEDGASDNVGKRRTITMLILVVIFCFMGLAPSHLLRLYLFLSGNWFSNAITFIVAFHLVGFTNSWLRVVFYIIFNDLIRQHFCKLFSLNSKRSSSKVECVASPNYTEKTDNDASL